MDSFANVVPSNPYVGPLPRIKIYFSLLSTCTEELYFYCTNYTVSAKSITYSKSSFSIKSNTISRIFELINIIMFGQINCSKQTIF